MESTPGTASSPQQDSLQFSHNRDAQGTLRLTITDKTGKKLEVLEKNVSSKSNTWVRVLNDTISALWWKKIYLPTGQKVFIHKKELSKKLKQSAIDTISVTLFLKQHKLISQLTRSGYSFGNAQLIALSVRDYAAQWEKNAQEVSSIVGIFESYQVTAHYNPRSKEITLALKMLGSGAAKTVWLEAEVKKGKNRVRKQAKDQLSKQFLEKDHNNLQKYTSPYIVKSYLIGGQYYAEFMNKGSLDQVDLKGEENKTHRLKLMQDACRGIQAVHRKGYVHNDIKPENILVKTHFRGDVEVYSAKLADFDTELPANLPGSVLGTTYYMSPEKIAASPPYGNKVQDTADDIWSLGVAYYEKKHGVNTLFSTNSELLEQIRTTSDHSQANALRQQYATNKTQLLVTLQTDDPEDQIILDCLNEDPQKRPSIDQIIARLEGIRA